MMMMGPPPLGRLGIAFLWCVILTSWGFTAVAAQDVYGSCTTEAYYANLLAQKPDPNTWSKQDVMNVMMQRGQVNDSVEALSSLWKGGTNNFVRVVYRNIEFPPILANSPLGWRAHRLWPLSSPFVTGLVGNSTKEMQVQAFLADIYGMAPADSSVVLQKGSLFFGVCGTVQPAQDCVRPATVETALTSEKDNVIFAPPDIHKGDVARALFYIHARYGPSLGLTLSDCPEEEDDDEYGKTFGYLSELLRWHEQDPVATDEIFRNNDGCSHWQGNRNPFVDYPELVQNLFYPQGPDIILPGEFVYSRCSRIDKNTTSSAMPSASALPSSSPISTSTPPATSEISLDVGILADPNVSKDFCAGFGGDIACFLDDFISASDGTRKKLEVQITCPVDSQIDFDFRKAVGCSCGAKVTDALGNQINCPCLVCPFDFGPSPISIDCSSNDEDPFLISSCTSMDCNFQCNGSCEFNCANSGPDCTLCVVTTTGPSSTTPSPIAASQGPTLFDPTASTPRPTVVPFIYEPEGDSSFGYQWRDDFRGAHLHSVRRPGWSWYQPGQGYAPFCFGDSCYDITAACLQLGGLVLHDYVCSFTDDVKVMGPSCWRGECIANGRAICDSLNGITVGEPDGGNGPQWCLFRGERSFVGPLCYGSDCHAQDTVEACDRFQGGHVWNQNFCVMDGEWTTIGPVCWNGICIFGDLETKCFSLGGELIARRWCMINGVNWTVIGPTCSKATSQFNQQCFAERTNELCSAVEGVVIGGRYCVLPGKDWTLIGPTSYDTLEFPSSTTNFCAELASEDGEDAFGSVQTWDIEGRFCLVNGARLPTAGPICTDAGCDALAGLGFCNRFGGKALAGGFMCTLPPTYRQVVGPLLYGDVKIEGNPAYCEGLFCAIPSVEAGSGPPTMMPTSSEHPTTIQPFPTYSPSTTPVEGSSPFAYTVKVRYDSFSGETSWTITDKAEDEVAREYSSAGRKQDSWTVALYPGEDYCFQVIDSFGDGICCSQGTQGFFQVLSDYNDKVVVSSDSLDGGKFSFESKESCFHVNDDGSTYPVHKVKVKILHDKFGAETAWRITNVQEDELFMMVESDREKSNELVTTNVFLPPGSYIFTISDSASDGLCCAYGRGKYSVQREGEELFGGGKFELLEIGHTFIIGDIVGL